MLPSTRKRPNETKGMQAGSLVWVGYRRERIRRGTILRAILLASLHPNKLETSVAGFEKLAFSNSFGLKSVPEKLRFGDGSVWKVGLA